MSAIDQDQVVLLGHDQSEEAVSIHASDASKHNNLSHVLVSGAAPKRAQMFAHLVRQFPAAGSRSVLIRTASAVPTAPDLRTLHLDAEYLAENVGSTDVMRQPHSYLWRERRGIWMLSDLICLELLRGERDSRLQTMVGSLLGDAVSAGVSTGSEALAFLHNRWSAAYGAQYPAVLEQLSATDFTVDPVWQALVGTADPGSVQLVEQVLTEDIEVIELSKDLPMPPYWVAPHLWSRSQRHTVVLLSALLGSISVPALEQNLAVLIEDMDAALVGAPFVKCLVEETSRTTKSWHHIWITGTASRTHYSSLDETSSYAAPRVLDLGEAGDGLARTDKGEFTDEIMGRQSLLRLASE